MSPQNLGKQLESRHRRGWPGFSLFAKWSFYILSVIRDIIRSVQSTILVVDSTSYAVIIKSLWLYQNVMWKGNLTAKLLLNFLVEVGATKVRERIRILERIVTVNTCCTIKPVSLRVNVRIFLCSFFYQL